VVKNPPSISAFEIADLLPARRRLGFDPTVTYDLNLAILIHCQSGNLLRIQCMQKCGVFHAEGLRVHLTIISSPGDFQYVEEIVSGWEIEADVSFLEMPSKEPIPKINGYYLWLMTAGPTARWHGRVDDDSITDLKMAVQDLDSRFRVAAVHVATSAMSWQENSPVFVPYLKERGITLPSVHTEFESSFTSHRGMQEIFSNEVARDMIIETARLFTSPGDRALAFAAHLARVPVADNPRSHWHFSPEQLSCFGGHFYHIHYVPWEQNGIVKTVRAFIAPPGESIHQFSAKKLTEHPLHLQIGWESSIVMTLHTEGIIIGGEEALLTEWKFQNDTLKFFSKDGIVLISFETFVSEGTEVIFQGYGVFFDKPVVGRLLTEQEIPSTASHEVAGNYCYLRLGYDVREITLAKNGKITTGAAGCERTWQHHSREGAEVLEIHGDVGRTCEMTKGEDGLWRGAWEVWEKMAVVLIPTV
jgi:hypothetical protein